MPDDFILDLVRGSLLHETVDALLLPVARGEAPAPGVIAISEALAGVPAAMLASGELGRKPYQVEVLPTYGRLAAGRVALVTLPPASERNEHAYRRAAAAAGRVLGKRGVRSVAAALEDFPLPAHRAALLLAEGIELSRFVTGTYRTGERREERLQELRVAAGGAELPAGVEAALREGQVRGRACNLARTLTNAPGNILNPPELARRAEDLAARSGLECTVLDRNGIEGLRMRAFLAVAAGSAVPPRLIVLRHHGNPAGPGAPPLLALIGKAVTFDSGGISLKPAADMSAMKTDMAGGAAVLAGMAAVAELGVPLNVLGIIPAVENLPGGRAWRPGDVITARSGKTIETITTDAEGRMLLADALDYARELGATHLVDIATLTGACAVALGGAASGLFANNDELAEAVRGAGEEAGELHWRLPLLPEYRAQIRSEIADMKNSGGRLAGAATAAAFLAEFAGETPWVHLDVAGTARADKALPWAPAGGTGVGTCTCISLAQNLATGAGQP